MLGDSKKPHRETLNKGGNCQEGGFSNRGLLPADEGGKGVQNKRGETHEQASVGRS